jgi:hemolysin activation/secretion protein
MNYTLGGQFSALGGHGEANNASIKMAFPLQLTATGNTEVWGMYRYRELRDVLDAVGDTNRRHVGHAELGVSSSGFDAFGGWNYAMLSYAAGELNLQNQAAKAADVYGQDGFFSKANMLLTRQQRLGARFGLTLLLQGQYAWQNLDSGEKFALGGPYSVRAYPVSELTGDDGWLAQCALQWYANEQVTLSVFADRGWVRFNADELRGNPWTDQYLSSAGVGFDWQGPYGFEVHASVAWAGDYESVADRGNTEGRFYGVLRKRF